MGAGSAALATVLVVALCAACGGTPTTEPAGAGVTTSGPPSASGHTASPATGSPGHSGGTESPGSNPGHLTDEQMVGQLFMTYVYGASATQATAAQRAANMDLYGVPTAVGVLRRWHLGGVILIDHNTLDPAHPTLSTGNVQAAAQIAGLTSSLQRVARADSGRPLLIATDQEGGRVQRITDGVSPRPAEAALAHAGVAALTCGYYSLGRQLRALGVNQDFAPDADVVTTSIGVIGDRSFGPDPSLDAVDVAAAVAGLQRAGVLATLKHWPGHGSTSTDSHASLAVVHRDPTAWRRIDRVPFARAASTAAAIMVGHLAVPALDPSGRAATFSPVLTAKLLRGGLGYDGLIVSDSLWMAPARAAGTPGQVALKALRAGIDVQLEPPDLPGSFDAVLNAVRHDRGVRDLVRGAVGHVLAAKAKAQAPPGPAPHC